MVSAPASASHALSVPTTAPQFASVPTSRLNAPSRCLKLLEGASLSGRGGGHVTVTFEMHSEQPWHPSQVHRTATGCELCAQDVLHDDGGDGGA